MTIDCGEGKHDLCIGWGNHSYLIPQLNGERFECKCQCHQLAAARKAQIQQQTA